MSDDSAAKGVADQENGWEGRPRELSGSRAEDEKEVGRQGGKREVEGRRR